MSIAFFRKRWVQPLLGILLTGVSASLLTATMFWTLFDPKWIAFLSGIVITGVIATLSQASRAQWRLARRTAESKRLRTRLAEAQARSQRAMEAFRASDLRLRLLGDAMAAPAFIVDTQEVCRFHNSAAAGIACVPADRIDGHALRDILGESYDELGAQLAAAHTSEAGKCIVLGMPAGARAASAASTRGHDFLVPDERGKLLFMRAIANELTGWDDPKAKLIDALREDRFVLVAQRIAPLDLGARDPLCFEVLLRLQEEEDNLLPPGGFLPVAERYGMLEDLDRWVVRHLVSHCLRQAGTDPSWRAPLYCVNLSKAAVASDAFAAYVQEQICRRGFDGHSLCFEIGEADVMASREAVGRLMAALRPLGCRFTVDAFGSASGSFAVLKGLAFDFVKIDGVIVQNIVCDPAALGRLKVISMVCHKLGLRAIAELVEDAETQAVLRTAGVDYMQGFGIARPERLVEAAASAARLPVKASRNAACVA